MKKVLCNLIFLQMIIMGYSQNLLSPIWKLHVINDLKEVSNLNDYSGQNVNLLLSWERQGHSAMDGSCVIKNHFFLNEKNTNMQLEFSFAAEVNAVYINQVKVIGMVPNSFWGDRGKRTLHAIPDSILKRNSRNELTIVFNHLSYTGGISHNFCSVHSANKGNENSLSINFPSDNHVYLENDKRKFTIQSKNISKHRLQITINSDDHKTLVKDSVELNEGKQDYVFSMKERNFGPGIYECIIISEGQYHNGIVEWFVIQPEDISCSAEKVPGFDTYWKDAMDELDKVDPNFKIKKVDSLCSSTRNGYIVEMMSLDNLTIRAYYFVPKTKGKHPVVLHLPGYTYGFEYLNGFINNKSNVADLALCVRGHGISKDVFNPWGTMTLWAVGICDEKEYVYRAMYMDCVRAVEFLMSQPEINSTKIGVAGGSQGGGLALATSGLCGSNIAACAIFDPWMCDFRHQASIRTVINKELESFTKYQSNTCNTEKMFSVLDLIDTKYFAADIKCPVYFSTSLFDDDCPSHCGFSVYNNLTTKKTYKVYPNDSHLGESGQYSDLYNVLEKILIEE